MNDSEEQAARGKAALGASLKRTLRELVASRVPDPAIAGAKHRVRLWQNRRFARTYADLAVQPRYKPAVEFFLVELYSDADTSARDADLQRVLPVMIKMLPAPALETILDALAFEALCERLDADVARELGTARLSVKTYGDAFRACGRPALRRRQVEYVGAVGHALDRLTRWPMVSTTLRLMRGPASGAGLLVLQEFLERGFHAFKRMRGAAEFLATIERRETAIVERLFAAHPRPFDLEDE
jgi:hypothetical protein